MVIKRIPIIVAAVIGGLIVGLNLALAQPISHMCYTVSETTQYEQAVADYEWVKENIKYRCSYWGTPQDTLEQGSGHCSAKAELLVDLLTSHGIKARYVEGRPSSGKLFITKLIFSDVHIWVEACVNGEWLTLDPTPDSGIVCLLGDTEPGTHLNEPTYITRWDELPPWYKEGYNSFPMAPFRFLTNVQLAYYRHFKCGE